METRKASKFGCWSQKYKIPTHVSLNPPIGMCRNHSALSVL